MMKTVICWLIARAPEVIIGFEVFIVAYINSEHTVIADKLSDIDVALKYLLIVSIITISFSIMVMIYTYRNIEEVLSRQFKWRNSNVDTFNYRLKYSWNRCQAVFLVFLILFYIVGALFNFEL